MDVLMYVCNDVLMYRSRQHQKVNLCSLMRTQWPLFIKLSMWVLPTWSVVTECAYLIPHLHICSDWLIPKKSNFQSSVWATLMELGMWVVMGTSTIHVVCCHQMCVFNTSFAYLFWLANNKKSNIPSSVWATLMTLGMWVVMGTSTTHVVCRHRMHLMTKKSNIQ